MAYLWVRFSSWRCWCYLSILMEWLWVSPAPFGWVWYFVAGHNTVDGLIVMLLYYYYIQYAPDIDFFMERFWIVLVTLLCLAIHPSIYLLWHVVITVFRDESWSGWLVVGFICIRKVSMYVLVERLWT
eukprot:UN03396